MLACRTVLRGFLTFMDITAIPAMPFYSSLFLKDCIFFYIIYQLPVTHLMELFHLGDFRKRLCYHGESLLFCDMCKSRIQGSPFKFFSFCSRKKVIYCFSDNPCRIHCCYLHISALDVFKEFLCMFFFLFSRFKKKCLYLFKPFIFCSAGKVGV